LWYHRRWFALIPEQVFSTTKKEQLIRQLLKPIKTPRLLSAECKPYPLNIHFKGHCLELRVVGDNRHSKWCF